MAFKVTVSRDDLYRELQRIQSVVEARNTIPILSSLLVEGEGSRVHLTAMNLEMTWQTSINADVEEPGKITLEARKTHDIVRELAGDVKIEVREEKEGWVALRADYANFRIPSLSPQDFPTLPAYGEKDFNEIEVGVLREMINKTYQAIAASPEEQRRALNGALFVHEDRSLKMVATDGHRLALIICESDKAALKPVNTIVPRRALGEVRKLLDEVLGEKEDERPLILCKQQENHVIFKRGDVTFLARVIDDRFPDYELVIPKKFEREISVEREALERALRHVSVLTHERTKPVIISLSKGRMMVKSNSPEIGEATEQVNVDYAQDEMEIGFNARYFLEVLAVIEEAKVLLRLNEPLSSAMILPAKDKEKKEKEEKDEDKKKYKDYFCIVMPMRI